MAVKELVAIFFVAGLTALQGALALTNALPLTFEYASPVKPSNWSYSTPSTSPCWFEAEQKFTAPVAPPTAADFKTNDGGEIVDVVPTAVADTYMVRGYVPAENPFMSNTTLIQLSDATCNLGPECSVAVEADNAPLCNIYAVDMAYCGTDGLVTDRDQALFVLVCSEPVSGLCAPNVDTCIRVTGPANSTVDYVDLVDPADSYYHTLVSWSPDYLGPVTVTFDCPLTDAAGLPLSQPIQTLQFNVTPIVAVRSAAYKIGSSIMNVGGDSGALLANPNDRPSKR